MDETSRKTKSPDWSDVEDTILAETVLGKLRIGETQKIAFDEAASKILGRTSAACAFRWNSVVRKRVQGEMEELRSNKKKSASSVVVTETIQQGQGSLGPTKSRRGRSGRKVENLDILAQLLSPERIKELSDYIQTLCANLSLFQNVRATIEEKDREIHALKESNTNLLAKVNRLESFEREFNVFAERAKHNA